jgi:hypothetical protein
MKTFLLIALATAMLAVAAPAMAQSPTQGAYSGTGANQVSSLNATSTTQTTSPTLPFTGLDLGAVSVVGIALLGTGFVVRRRTKSDTH